MISATYLQGFLDHLEASWRNADAAARTTILSGMTAALVGGDGTVGHTAYGAGDLTFITKLASAVAGMQAAAVPDTLQQGIYRAFFQALDGYLASVAPATPTLDSYLSAQNATPFTLLVGPNTADLYWLYKSGGARTATTLLTAGNVYPPVTTLGSGTVGGGGAITWTAGSAVRIANVTGPPAQQGYAPAVGMTAQVTTNINGTLTLQATVTGKSAAGAVVAGQLWTATLDNKTAGQTADFTPPAAGQRITQVTAMTFTGSPTATAGAFTVVSKMDRTPTS